jgi:hypothetical protein
VAGDQLDQADVHADVGDPTSAAGFSVTVGSFEGPFDLLLQLISKHKLEVTELALHIVTDEFIAYLRAQGPEWDLDETTEFLVVAATLLDLKAARLLPSGEVEDEEDLALLEARDLLFARLLQYRAYKEVSSSPSAWLGPGVRCRVPWGWSRTSPTSSLRSSSGLAPMPSLRWQPRH